MMPIAFRREDDDVTLIAGFKCADGYVMCADSQQTVKIKGASYRMTRQQLVPVKIGLSQMAIAGSGDGRLIDAFVGRLKRQLKGSKVTALDSFQELFKEELATFAKEKRIRSTKVDDHLRFLIGIHSPETNECSLWETLAGDPMEVEEYTLVGFQDTRYDYAVQNYYRPDMPISQGVFLGLYLMALGEQTSNYIRAPIRVVVLKNNGLYFEDPKKINSIDQKVRLFATAFESQFLACSDTSLHNDAFVRNFKEFGKTIVQFRSDFVAEWVGKALERGFDRVIESWNEMPTGTIVVTATGPGVGQSISEMQKRGAEALRKTHAHVQEQDRIDKNLQTLRAALQIERAKLAGDGRDPTDEERRGFYEALGEINQAAIIGPMPLRPDFCNLLGRLAGVMLSQMDMDEQHDQEMHKACVALRIAVIDQTVAYMNRAKQLVSQKKEGQP
jgi:hypothetical protein